MNIQDYPLPSIRYYTTMKQDYQQKTMLKPNESELKYFEQLFGSKTRVKILRLFLVCVEPAHYYIREICRITGEHLNSVRRELNNLENLGLIAREGGRTQLNGGKKGGTSAKAQLVSRSLDEGGAKADTGKIFYKVNKEFILFNELKDLFIKSQLLLEKSLIQRLGKIGNVQLLVLTGAFTSNQNSATDLLVVGRVKAAPLLKIVKQFEKELGRNINYTLLSTSEFAYRRDLTDLFLYNILENKKVILIDNLGVDRKKPKKDYSRRKIQVKKGK